MRDKPFMAICSLCGTELGSSSISVLVSMMLEHDEEFHPESIESGKAAIQANFGEDIAREQDS